MASTLASTVTVSSAARPTTGHAAVQQRGGAVSSPLPTGSALKTTLDALLFLGLLVAAPVTLLVVMGLSAFKSVLTFCRTELGLGVSSSC